jgi:diaminopimelate epimerase
MKKMIGVPFHKLHALGNDFIVATLDDPLTPLGESEASSFSFAPRPFGGEGVPQRGAGDPSTGSGSPQAESRGEGVSSHRSAIDNSLARLAQAVCDRHIGIGADGFLVVEASRKPGYDAAVRFFNADGSEAEMSGNGIRCAGAYLLDLGGYTSPLRIKTVAGIKVLEAVKGEPGKWTFRVRMGHPVFSPKKIPFAARGVSAPVMGYTLETSYGKHCVTVTSMGNPHCSVFVKNFRGIDWRSIGSEIETHRLFPNRTNVEFVRVISRRAIEVRFWERGVGETASSGTGSCAAVVASILNGFAVRSVRAKTVAGSLDVEWPNRGEVILTGPATAIARGSYFYESGG